MTNEYKLKEKSYYAGMMNENTRLFNSAWSQYRMWLNGAIDDPTCDSDVIGWIDNIISEKVNNPRSTFYIYGK